MIKANLLFTTSAAAAAFPEKPQSPEWLPPDLSPSSSSPLYQKPLCGHVNKWGSDWKADVTGKCFFLFQVIFKTVIAFWGGIFIF